MIPIPVRDCRYIFSKKSIKHSLMSVSELDDSMADSKCPVDYGRISNRQVRLAEQLLTPGSHLDLLSHQDNRWAGMHHRNFVFFRNKNNAAICCCSSKFWCKDNRLRKVIELWRMASATDCKRNQRVRNGMATSD